jgi:chemotaxis protein methyltransferase CheR
MAIVIPNTDVEDLEVELLLEGVYRRYGFDFREYATSSIRRRILEFVRTEALNSVSSLQDRVLHDSEAMDRMLQALTVHVTSMFRDPNFYLAFREKVVPFLRTYPFTRIWHAGCATGEEVYSMAIMLIEEGLYNRCRIYATDMNDGVLHKAREGIFPLSAMQEYTTNYLRAGGRRSFSEYYTSGYDHAIFRPALRERVVFAQHNLATDGSFNEFQVIVCRNVLIYFDRQLQDRVYKLFSESLVRLGVLALGRRESLRFTAVEDQYDPLDERERIFRKMR